MASVQENLQLVETGEREGSASATALPSVGCRFVSIMAFATNTGTVYVGDSTVTVPGGTADQTSGWPLAAGKSVTLPVRANANELYYICSDANQDLHYLCEGPIEG